jgi:hypothetical protein
MSSHTLRAASDLMGYDSRSSGEFATSSPRDAVSVRDAVFERLLRLATSFALSQKGAAQGGPDATVGTTERRSLVTENIELRAYHIYLGRGGTDGHDLDDWLQAECQVLEGLKKNKTSLRLALAFGFLKDSAER